MLRSTAWMVMGSMLGLMPLADRAIAAGKFDGDNDSQVAAIENLISAGAKGFAIVPSRSTQMSMLSWFERPSNRGV